MCGKAGRKFFATESFREMRPLLGCGWRIEAMIEIEERKQADQEFRKLLDVSPQYMCVYASDGSPLYANDGLLDYFGFTMDDFRADDFQARVFHPNDLERVRTVPDDAMRRGEGWEVEARTLRRDGHSKQKFEGWELRSTGLIQTD
jgi:PAS domain S-box-containing protein